MARVSLNRRIDAILNHYLPVGSLEHKIHHLPDDLQKSYRLWNEGNQSIINEAEKKGAGEAYRQLIDNELELPPLPKAIEQVLFPENGRRYDNVYHHYQSMLEG